MIEEYISNIIRWGRDHHRIKAILLVGSYARNEQRTDSDIDLVVITDDKNRLLQCDWIDTFGDVASYRIEEYGACTSIRVFYKESFEVEYGIVDTSWLSNPLDDGTIHVLSDGYKLLYGAGNIDDSMIKDFLEKKEKLDL